MKLFFLIFFIIVSFVSSGQSFCNGSFPIDYIYYPNSVSTQTNTGTTFCSYLCGPNTTLIDTNSYGCRQFYVNPNCTLTFKTPICGVNSIIWVKNNGVLNLVGGGTVNLEIYFEPLAVINNTAGVSYYSGPCTSVSFPTVSCVTGILNDKQTSTSVFLIYPNPSCSKINIEFAKPDNQSKEVIITNQLGQVVYKRTDWNPSDKEIPIDNFSNGSYFVHVRTETGSRMEKLIVIR